jgi:hypothetical protein
LLHFFRAVSLCGPAEYLDKLSANPSGFAVHTANLPELPQGATLITPHDHPPRVAELRDMYFVLRRALFQNDANP